MTIPLRLSIVAKTWDNSINMPIFVGHGEADRTVFFECAADMKLDLQIRGYTKMSDHSYPMMRHTSNEKEMLDLKHWFDDIVNKQAVN